MIGLSRRYRLLAIGFGFIGLAIAGPAAAEEPVESAIKGWISTLDASPYWVAGFAEMSYDPATHAATIKNLSIRSETLATKFEISFGTVTVTGFGETADGGLQASSVSSDNGAIIFGDIIDARLTNIDISNLAIPNFNGFRFDPAHVFTSLVKAYSLGAKSSVDKLHVGNLSVTQSVQGQKTATSFGSYDVIGMKDGLIESVTMGPFAQESPSPDGLVDMKVEKLEAKKYDLDALAAVLDPDRYVGGVGDNKWRTVIGLESYRNMSVTVPGGSFHVGSAEMENLKIRQPAKNFAEFFDALIATPNMGEAEIARLVRENIAGLLGFAGVDAFRLADIDVNATGLSRFHLGDFHINDLSSDGMGEIGIGDLDAAVEDKGSVGAERLALGGFKFPSLDTITRTIVAEQNGVETDSLALIPTLGYVEAVNVDATQAGKPLFSLDRGRLDLSNFIGPVPTTAAVDMRGIDVDTSQIDDRKARDLLEGLGYDRLKADYVFKLSWREVDESVTLSDFKLAIQDLATISGDAFLTGLKRSTLEHPREIEAALDTLMFSHATIAVADKSVVNRAIGMQAKKMNIDPEKFRQQITGALPLFMMVLKNPGFQSKLAPALQAFLKAPGTFTIHAEPTSPVPMTDVIETANSHPEKLPDLLNVDVKSAQ